MSVFALTAEDVYKKFLQGIRKVDNRTVPPDQFDSWYGDATLDWLRQKIQLPEFNSKRIEDLEKFLVVTDGTTYPFISPYSANVFPVPSKFANTGADGIMMAQYDSGTYMAVVHPLYLHGLSATFMDGDTEFYANVKRTNQNGVRLWDKYRKVTASRPYYQYKGDTITIEGRNASQMILSYYRYPCLVSYVNSIDPETNPEQTEEIVQIAVRLFLENRGDPRYKSKLQEMMVTQQGK